MGGRSVERLVEIRIAKMRIRLRRGADEFRNLGDEVYLTLVTWIYDPFDQISDGVIVGSQKIG